MSVRFLRAVFLSGMLAVTAANAEGLRLSTGAPDEVAQIATGEKLLFERFNGSLSFAGQQLQLQNWTGMLGYASDVAYLVTISGSGTTTDQTEAAAGQMLMILPYAPKAFVQRFDAARLQAAWTATEADMAPAAYAGLTALSKKQARSIFWGRLVPTSFNVAASGAPQAEPGRRNVLGGKAVRNIRFAADNQANMVEQKILSRFLIALKTADAATVAELMDPLPYGNMGLSQDGGDARRLMAEQLLAQQNWQQLLGDAVAERLDDGSVWTVAGPGGRTFITLRPMGDFAFVRDVQIGS